MSSNGKSTTRKASNEQQTTSTNPKRRKINEANLSVKGPAQVLRKTDVAQSSTHQQRHIIDSAENVSPDGKPEPKTSRIFTSPREETQNENDVLGPEKTVERYETSGLTQCFHGISYQKNLLIHFLKYGVDREGENEQYSFGLATEMKAADKFDDVVYRYKVGNSNWTYRFLQAKHKQGKKIDITASDLLTTSKKKNQYALQKYFESFCKIKKNKLFENCELRDFIICTNIGLNQSLNFTPICEDEILNFPETSSKLYQLDFDKFPEKYRLKLVLEKIEKSETQMREFFQKLVFAVNMPNETQLNRIIAKDMSKKFNLDDITFPKDQLETFILDWMTTEEGKILTYQDGATFFQRLEQKISELVVAYGITPAYCAEIEAFSMKFSDTSIPSMLTSFLSSEKERVFNFISSHESTKLSAIKVKQALSDMPAYQKNDSFIFMHLSSILPMQKRIIEAFGSKTAYSLLIIECGVTNRENVQQLFASLLSIMKKPRSNKKIILITQKKNALAEKFGDNFSANTKYIEIHDEKNSIIDLSKDSQEKLWNRKIFTFQEGGTDLSLETLLSNENSEKFSPEEKSKYLLREALQGELLFKLIKNDEKINIGKAPKDQKYDAAKNYFIDRSFFRYVNIDRKIESSTRFLVIDKMKGINGSNPQQGQDVIIISDTCEDFVQYCDKYKFKNIHWFKSSETDFLWQQSQGNVSKLRKFVDMKENRKTKHNPNKITDISDKLVLIAAEPGMGKSVILSHLAIKTSFGSSPLWIVRCNLIDYSFKFAKWKEEIGIKETVRFLYEITEFQLFEKYGDQTRKEQMIIDFLNIQDNGKTDLKIDRFKDDGISSLSLFEVQLFTWFYNRGNVALLLDGFDEISPNYKDQVEKLIQVLKPFMMKIWMTTRPLIIQNEAENMLSTLSYELEPFTPDDQKSFLEKFFGEKLKPIELNKQRANVYIDELLDTFSQRAYDLQRSFVSVPLQIYMFAEIFSIAFEEFHGSENPDLSEQEKQALHEKLNLNSLYEKFTLEKYLVQRRKADTNYDQNRYKVENSEIDEDQYKKFLKAHRRLAVGTTLEDVMEKFPSQNIVKKVTRHINQLEKEEIKTGIIDRIINNKPNFIHHTFAEYFTADFLWKKFKTTKYDDGNKFEEFIDGIIIGKLVMDDRKQICAFLRSKAEKDLDFPDFQKKLATLTSKLFDTWLNKRSTVVEEKQFEQDGVEFASPKLKSSFSLLLGIIETTLQKCHLGAPTVFEGSEDDNQYELLQMCAITGYIELTKALTLTKKINKTFIQNYLKNHRWADNILMIATQNGHLDVAELLAKTHDIISWKDGINGTFFSTILEGRNSKVLENLSKTNIFDVGKPYTGNYKQKLLLFEGISKTMKSDTIKLLLNRTDIDVIERFIDFRGWDRIICPLSFHLSAYDDEISELLIKKGIDFSSIINFFLYKFVRYRINDFYFEDGPRYFEMIDLFLKRGVSYNCKIAKTNDDAVYDYRYELKNVDTRNFSLNEDCKLTTLDYSKQICLWYALFHTIENPDPKLKADINRLFNRILKLIIKSYGKCCDLKGYEIIFEHRQTYLVPNFEHNSNEENKIPLRFLEYWLKLDLFFDKSNPKQSPLNEIYSFINEVKETPHYFNTYPYCYLKDAEFQDIFFNGDNLNTYAYYGSNIDEEDYVYRHFIHLPNSSSFKQIHHSGCIISDSEKILKESQFSKLSVVAKHLLKVIIKLSQQYSYGIVDAFENVSKEIQVLTELKSTIQEMERNSSEDKILLKTEDVLNILKMKIEGTCFNKALQNFSSDMSKCGGVHLMRNVLIKLTELFKKDGIEKRDTTTSNRLIAEQSEHLFELLTNLDGQYNDLCDAIEIGECGKIENILEKNPAYKKSIIHGQSEKFGSPLHYVACKGDREIIKILLSHGANPNLRLYETGIPKLLLAENSEKIEENEDLPMDYYGWTPLHLAASSGHNEIVQLLINKGAKVNSITISESFIKGNTSLHLSVLGKHLETVQLLLQNGACYDVKNAQHKTPLELAKSGSDVADLLQCVDQLFQDVEERKKHSVCLLLERHDSDLLKVILNAKNAKNNTLLSIAKDNEQDDVIDLLEEKLRSFQ